MAKEDKTDGLSFWEHLDVLRTAIVKIVAVAVVFGIAAFCFKEKLFAVILAPKNDGFITYRLFNRIAAWAGGETGSFAVQLINTGLAGQFVIHMKTALCAGVLCASPYILYQLFRFVSPALYACERKYAVRIVGGGYAMFLMGVAVSYFLIFPLTFRFLGTYQVSIFSGANNFKVFTVLDDEFSDDFGITEKEMDKIIEDFEVQDEKEEIKKWYDGYIIGHTEGIYNPWSILNYLKNKELKPYWVNTSSNDLIKLILKNSATVKEKIEQLLRDEEIEVPINLETVIVGIEQNEENIWGLLLGTGYLKVTGVVDLAMGVYKVKIPNYEIKFLFQNIIRDWFNDKVIGNNLNTILKDLVTLKLDEFEQKFKVLVRQMFSFMDVGENTAENFYHAFVLGMLVGLKDNYYVKSNRESGYGRYDIMLEPKDKNGNSFIMEFKVYREEKEKDINDTIENAKKQIEERKYEENLQKKGFTNITKMVFAFKGKEVKMQVV